MMDKSPTTEVKPVCKMCCQRISDWQYFIYVCDGFMITICKNCINEYTKVVCGGIKESEGK